MRHDRRRILFISLVAVLTADAMCFIARGLVSLIDVFVNLFFYGRLSFAHAAPWGHSLGVLVMLLPAAGGIIVGLMAYFGSRAIRGHGIPEAMEQVLTNESRIKPSITILKPLSAAISIGSGGPFGAEGPIIATGSALGSMIGQFLRITTVERKILLASGATAGMSAIFGSPLAAICLAFELLLFEFSPRSLIPVTLACITGAAGHRLFFESGPMFPVPPAPAAANLDLFVYSLLGGLTGLASVGVTRAVYGIEDLFERLPIHWMWWPALGGLFVGFVGVFAPRTMGVGYENITAALSGKAAVNLLITLCFLKFLSWSISLGSGTSGGTLAPLLTIGGAGGALAGLGMDALLPGCVISVSMCALFGMAGMLAGPPRALRTSIVFALETTGEIQGLLPLIAGCTGAYLVSFFLMETTIMTEKISRRGVLTPDTLSFDPGSSRPVLEIMQTGPHLISTENSLKEIRSWLERWRTPAPAHLIVVDSSGRLEGTLQTVDLYRGGSRSLASVLRSNSPFVTESARVEDAAAALAASDFEILPVLSSQGRVIGTISTQDILRANHAEQKRSASLSRRFSLRRRGVRLLVHGRKILPKR